MVVLFEGIDTCGKSTQIARLKQIHPEIITTKEPGGTQFGIKAREILLESSILSKRAELLLFLADRAEHYEEVIRPNQHKLIISDRGFISGIGYALANGDFDLDEMIYLNTFALQGNLPDKVILFLTDLETLQERLGSKELDGIELRGLEYLLKVQDHMKETILKMDIPHLFIDAADSIENIHQTILTYLKV
ncbi:MAG: dTMP kinase [Sulfurimonas sp.]